MKSKITFVIFIVVIFFIFNGCKVNGEFIAKPPVRVTFNFENGVMYENAWGKSYKYYYRMQNDTIFLSPITGSSPPFKNYTYLIYRNNKIYAYYSDSQTGIVSHKFIKSNFINKIYLSCLNRVKQDTF